MTRSPPVVVLLRTLACLLLVAALARPAWAGPVTVVLSDGSAPYREFAAALRSGMAASASAAGDAIAVITLQEFDGDRAGADPGDALFVTVGVRAARSVRDARPHGRILATLIPREAYESLFGGGGDDSVRSVSAIFIDQPLARQLDLLRLAMPAARRVGVLLGSHTRHLTGELERLCRERDLRLAVETVDGTADLVPAMQRLLGHSDVLLALADDSVFNSATAETVLLLSYRRSVPVLGFSRAYVKAGALLGLHTTPDQFGRQAAELATQMVQGGQRSVPLPQYPRYFQVSWNRAVAQSLEIPVRDEAELGQRLGGGGRP